MIETKPCVFCGGTFQTGELVLSIVESYPVWKAKIKCFKCKANGPEVIYNKYEVVDKAINAWETRFHEQ